MVGELGILVAQSIDSCILQLNRPIIFLVYEHGLNIL